MLVIIQLIYICTVRYVLLHGKMRLLRYWPLGALRCHGNSNKIDRTKCQHFVIEHLGLTLQRIRRRPICSGLRL